MHAGVCVFVCEYVRETETVEKQGTCLFGGCYGYPCKARKLVVKVGNEVGEIKDRPSYREEKDPDSSETEA